MNVIAEEYPTDREIRETAVLLLAAESALCDSLDAETALEYARKLEWSVDNDPTWAGGRHEGDCTKVPAPCARCYLEDMENRARKMWDE